MALVPELEEIRRQLEAASTAARVLCDGLDEEELGWRPAPGRWSIAENLIHLELTTRIFLPVVDAAIEAARAEGRLGHGPFRLGVMGRLYLWYVEPPPVLKLPAPKAVAPSLDGSPAEALSRFLSSQENWLGSIKTANGLDICRVRITSPLARFVRMSLLAVFAVAAGHERRHLWQAENVRRQLPGRNSLAL